MKTKNLIDFFKWFFAFAVFGIAVYAIYQSWDSIKNFFKPSQYAKDPKKGQTTFEKYFPNVAEAKDRVVAGSSNAIWNIFKKKSKPEPVRIYEPDAKVKTISPAPESFSISQIANRIFNPVTADVSDIRYQKMEVGNNFFSSVINPQLPVANLPRPVIPINTEEKTVGNIDPPVQVKDNSYVYSAVNYSAGRRTITVPEIVKNPIFNRDMVTVQAKPDLIKSR